MISWLKKHKAHLQAMPFLRYLGPGLLVTVGFIDPGNWAANVAAGSQYGYALLWMVTLSTIMLILLQHNAAHLGIVSGLCLSEAATKYTPKIVHIPILGSAVLAGVSTALAEILGAAIGLNMLFHIPIIIGSILAAGIVLFLLFTNTYPKLERIIIGFVSIIGFAFIYELFLVKINWASTLTGWTVPAFPGGALPIIMSVLGAVVMPHNLFLHSEIIQSRQWNLKSEKLIQKQLKYEFTDTLFSMLVGWAINSAIIIICAAVFFSRNIQVTELSQAQATLSPLLGNGAGIVFAIALLFAGIASSLTAAMAGGSIFAGIFSEPFNIKDPHSKAGSLISVLGALLIIFFIKDTYHGLIFSQIILSIQLPWTIFLQIALTSNQKVMGKYVNSFWDNFGLLSTGAIVTGLNIALLISLFK